jgi:hypothetical protein
VNRLDLLLLLLLLCQDVREQCCEAENGLWLTLGAGAVAAPKSESSYFAFFGVLSFDFLAGIVRCTQPAQRNTVHSASPEKNK